MVKEHRTFELVKYNTILKSKYKTQSYNFSSHKSFVRAGTILGRMGNFNLM